MEQNNVNSTIEEVSSDVLCENEGLDKKDLLKAGGVIAGTIVVWEVGKKLAKKGWDKVAPTKAGQLISKANPKTVVNNIKAKKASKVAEAAEKVAE